MATLTWQESLPSDASAIGRSPAEIRQHIVSVALGLGEQLDWPGSGAGSELSAGALKAGASRPFLVTASQVSQPGPQHLLLTSDTSRLFFFPSGTSALAGSIALLEHATLPAVDRVWVVQTGTTPLSISGSTTVTFAISFNGTPVVTLASDISGIAFGVAPNAGSFVVHGRDVSAPSATATIAWQALGRVRGAGEGP